MPALIEFRPGHLPHVEALSARSREQLFRLPKHFIPGTDMPISQIAALSGMCRETFTRRFSRDAGISPRDCRMVSRLNEARRKLRVGMPLAAVALTADFSIKITSHATSVAYSD
jgi:AraC-like DNA-binding protein